MIYDDVKLEFFHTTKIAQKKAFHLWFHTSFVGESGILIIDKNMIDKAHSDKKHVKYDRNFRIEVHMSQIVNYKMESKSFKIK